MPTWRLTLLLTLGLALSAAPLAAARKQAPRTRRTTQSAEKRITRKASKPAPAVRVEPVGETARLLVNGKLIAIFRTPNGSLGPRERADMAATRLRELIGGGLRASHVEAREKGDAWALYARGGLIMIATPAEAAERKEAAEVTARRWAANLKAALGESARTAAIPEKAVPPTTPVEPDTVTLGAENPSLTVPLGETRTMKVRGSADGALTTRVEGEAVEAAPVFGKAAIEVRGVQVGRAVVRFGREGKESGFTVWVKKYAGRVDGQASAAVTGSEAPGSLVRRVALERALDVISSEMGATVKLAGDVQGARALGRGDEVAVNIPLEIAGAGYLTLRSTVRVQVHNLPLPPRPAELLLYSNDPESFRDHGTLFEGPVEAGGPARLFFHHQNRTGKPARIQVHLANPGTEPVDVQVIGGDAGPYIDPLQAGHRAGQRYMAAALQDLGFVARISARSSRQVYTATLPERESVSGIYTFRVVQGGPLVALVTASTDGTTPEIDAELLDVARGEPHLYPRPQKEAFFTYQVGGKWTFMPVGRQPIPAKNPNRKLFGNYGVLYDLTVEIENPTDRERTVNVVFSPEANWARGVFVIEGKLIEAPQLSPPMERILYSVKLGPMEKRRLSVQAMPVGGSAYPIALVVRAS